MIVEHCRTCGERIEGRNRREIEAAYNQHQRDEHGKPRDAAEVAGR